MTPEQKQAVQDFENVSGFEFMHQDELAGGTMTFRDAWNRNIHWLTGMVTECQHIKCPYDDD